MASNVVECVEDATVQFTGRAKFIKAKLTREIPAVCMEVTGTPLFSVMLDGHEKLFRSFEISHAETFFTRPPNLRQEATIDSLITMASGDVSDLAEEVSQKLPAISMFVNNYFEYIIAVVEKDVGLFFEKLLSCFVKFPRLSQREVRFHNVKPNCPRGSIDGLIGRGGNGNRPVATIKNCNEFSTVHVVAIKEVKLDGRLSGFLSDSRTKTLNQSINQSCRCVLFQNYAHLQAEYPFCVYMGT